MLATAWQQVSLGIYPRPATLDATFQQAIDIKAIDPGTSDNIGGSSSLYDFNLVNNALQAAGRPQLKQP